MGPQRHRLRIFWIKLTDQLLPTLGPGPGAHLCDFHANSGSFLAPKSKESRGAKASISMPAFSPVRIVLQAIRQRVRHLQCLPWPPPPACGSRKLKWN